MRVLTRSIAGTVAGKLIGRSQPLDLPHAPGRARDGRNAEFWVFIGNANGLARPGDHRKAQARPHGQAGSGSRWTHPAGRLVALLPLARLRRSRRGGARGGPRGTHVPPLAPPPLSWQAPADGQGAWRDAEVHLRHALKLPLARLHDPHRCNLHPWFPSSSSTLTGCLMAGPRTSTLRRCGRFGVLGLILEVLPRLEVALAMFSIPTSPAEQAGGSGSADANATGGDAGP